MNILIQNPPATIAVARQVAIPGGIPLVSPASTSPAITGLDDTDLVYRTVPSDLYQGSVMASLLFGVLYQGGSELAFEMP